MLIKDNKTIDVVFVLVNYNTNKDLVNFIKKTKKIINNRFRYKFVCVDNYSNKKVLDELKALSENFSFELIENENLGYGQGNNIGIDFACNKYKFDYLVVSNCDIEIEKFDLDTLNKYSNSIIAPKIINSSNRNQNPMYYKEQPLVFKILNYSNIKESMLLQKVGIVLSKFVKLFNKLFKVNDNKIFSCHGSFIVFSKPALEKLIPVFDSKMFLLCEEMVLAMKAKEENISIFYEKNISVKHFEDASMGDYNTQEKNFKLWKNSYDIFYKKYYSKS